MSYEDETRQRIEARKRNAELKKEQQIKKRKITLGILAAAIVTIIIGFITGTARKIVKWRQQLLRKHQY